MPGKLYLIGTPIGNIRDITLRAVETLFSVDVLLCEDTRKTSKLLNLLQEQMTDYGLRITGFTTDNKLRVPKLVRFDENVERVKTPKVLVWLKEGKRVGLTTDAGMPGVSDPGMYLVGKCYAAGLQVDVIPGVSALTTAVAVAGFEAKTITFVGFLPKKEGTREKRWQDLRFMILDSRIKPATVFYESPVRLRQLLGEIRDNLHDPMVAACGELTKLHEKLLRGKASEVLERLPEVVKGEWVVVVRI